MAPNKNKRIKTKTEQHCPEHRSSHIHSKLPFSNCGKGQPHRSSRAQLLSATALLAHRVCCFCNRRCLVQIDILAVAAPHGVLRRPGCTNRAAALRAAAIAVSVACAHGSQPSFGQRFTLRVEPHHSLLIRHRYTGATRTQRVSLPEHAVLESGAIPPPP